MSTIINVVVTEDGHAEARVWSDGKVYEEVTSRSEGVNPGRWHNIVAPTPPGSRMAFANTHAVINRALTIAVGVQ